MYLYNTYIISSFYLLMQILNLKFIPSLRCGAILILRYHLPLLISRVSIDFILKVIYLDISIKPKLILLYLQT